MTLKFRAMSDHKIFKNPILEKLSKTNSYVAITFYIVTAGIMCVYGMKTYEINVGLVVVMVLFGLLVFTLLEYLFHRFVYHSGDDYKDQKNWQYKVHGVHHTYPVQKDLLALPIPLAIVVASAFFFLFYWPLGHLNFFFFPGFLLGYAGYLFVHFKVHTSRPPNNMLKYLWKHHHIHHYKYENKAFGVSSPFWDLVFNTMPPKDLKKN